MSEHTPGPWRWKKRGRWEKLIGAKNYEVIGGCGPSHQPGFVHCSEADAALIAAAPDLLEALGRLIEHAPVRKALAPRGSLGSLLDQAEAAIAKAEGRS